MFHCNTFQMFLLTLHTESVHSVYSDFPIDISTSGFSGLLGS